MVTALLTVTALLAQTSRRRAVELSRAYAALLEEEHRRRESMEDFETLLDVVPIGIAVARDPECRTVWTNPALAGMLSVPPGGNISKSAPDADHPYRMLRDGEEVPPEELPMQRAARTGKPVMGEPLEIVRSGGAPLSTLSYSAPLFDRNGGVRGVVNACVDVTALVNAEREREGLLEKLQRSEKLKSLALMAGGMAHDFNNLLTAIIGHASLARDSVPEGSPVRDHLGACLRASSVAARLVRRLLAYSGHAFRRLESLDVGRLVREVEPEIRAHVPQGARLEVRAAAGLPPIRGDGEQLREVVLNVVDNAFDALAGEGVVEIGTGCCVLSAAEIQRRFPEEDLQPGVYVRLEIRDTGCGMTPEVARNIFEPFFTTKFTGRGLGLSAAQGIVHGHRGGIRVESAAGRGTLVEIVFPADCQAGMEDFAKTN
jgi:signal transduction histidine kinase